MAFASSCVWEVRTTGATTNGGAFDPISGTPGTDYSQQTTPQVTFTDLVIGATTTQCTSALAPFTSAHVGNIINITSGTGFTVQRVQILSVAGVTATCDKSLGTTASVGGNGKLGGCLATIGGGSGALTLAVAGNTIFVKATATYSISSGLSLTNSGSSALAICLIGYNATRGDNGMVTVQATAGIGNCFTLNQNYWRLYNLVADANGQTTTGCFSSAGGNLILGNCIAKNFTTGRYGFQFTNNYQKAFDCWATGGLSGATAAFGSTGGSSNEADFDSCVAIGNACTGFVLSDVGGSTCDYCISANNTGASSDGFQVTTGATIADRLKHCLSYGNGRDGLRFTAAGGPDAASVLNCIFVNNGGFGINSATTNWAVGPAATQPYLLLINYNFYFGNSSGSYNNLPAGQNDIAGTGDPTVAGASGNFVLNNTAGAGAACRAAGFPGVLQSGGTGFSDIGALQHQDSPAVIAPVYSMVETRYQ